MPYTCNFTKNQDNRYQTVLTDTHTSHLKAIKPIILNRSMHEKPALIQLCGKTIED